MTFVRARVTMVTSGVTFVTLTYGIKTQRMIKFFSKETMNNPKADYSLLTIKPAIS